MIGKLKTLEEIMKDKKVKKIIGGITISYSKSEFYISVYEDKFKNFGNVIEVKLFMKYRNRIVYYDGILKAKYDQLYYDEWFLWIGEKMEHIPKELWSIEDL